MALAIDDIAAPADASDALSRLMDLCVSGHLLSKLKSAQSMSRAALDTYFSRIGITIPQFLALANIDQSEDISSAELARRSYVTPQAMITIVARLCSSGLITRAPARTGGRALPIRLTPKGSALLAQARAHAYAIERYVVDVLGDGPYAQLLASLMRVTEALSAQSGASATAPWESYLDAPANARAEHRVSG